MSPIHQPRIFDAHFHVIDRRYPLIANNGYLPHEYGCHDYLARMQGYRLVGGAIVSGSFQGTNQAYLLDALQMLGNGFVGVTQLPYNVSDETLQQLNAARVRALRFNIKRGGPKQLQYLDRMARRVHELVGWHVELYIDSAELPDLYEQLRSLPAVSIDHLGLSRDGFPVLLKLAEQGVRVKASGFGRVDFDIEDAMRDLYSANPQVLMFGSDLPSTRSPRPFTDGDVVLIADALGIEAAEQVLFRNAWEFYRLG